ncbi:MAG: magnesium transporter [Desulfurococcaceae archaeon]
MKEWLIPLITLAMAEALAGLSLKLNIDLLIQYPVLLVLIPGLMDLRGNVYGAVGYRLVKGLHLGLTKPSLFTRFNLINVLTGYVISVIATLFLCLIGTALSHVAGLGAPSPISLLFIASMSTLIVFAILTPFTVLSIIHLYRNGHDPSPFVATIVTGIGDVLTPIALITIAYLHEAFNDMVKALFIIVFISATIISSIYIVRAREHRNLLENLVSSVIASSGSSFGGFFLATMTYVVGENPEVIGVLPAFNAVIGAAMGYLSNSLNIDLHLGVENPRSAFYGKTLVGLAATYASIILALVLTSPSSLLLVFRFIGIITCITISCIAIYSISVVITYLLTTMSFNHGWDPDNLVFPLMTTFVDLTGPIALSLTTYLFM